MNSYALKTIKTAAFDYLEQKVQGRVLVTLALHMVESLLLANIDGLLSYLVTKGAVKATPSA